MKSLLAGIVVALINITSAYESGIQYGRVTLSDLNNHGCYECYNVLYSESTTTADVSQCAGPILFVGAKENGNSTFHLGAYGLSSEIQTLTAVNRPHLSYGVNWYKTSSYSFGFLDKRGQLYQSTADTGMDYSYSRLSWHLDQNVGGYRAGSYYKSLDGASKIIYNCPASQDMTSSPSPRPTSSLSRTPNPPFRMTNKPTYKPSVRGQSSKPTPILTQRPTLQPTSRPTSRPSGVPTSKPSGAPTSQPTSDSTRASSGDVIPTRFTLGARQIIKGLNRQQAGGAVFQGRLRSLIGKLIFKDRFILRVVQILGSQSFFHFTSVNSTVTMGYEIEIQSDINQDWYINILNNAVSNGSFAYELSVPGEARLTVEGSFYPFSILFLSPSPKPSPYPSSAKPTMGYQGGNAPYGFDGSGHESESDVRGYQLAIPYIIIVIVVTILVLVLVLICMCAKLRIHSQKLLRLQTEAADRAEVERRERIEANRISNERTASLVRILENRRIDNVMGSDQITLNI